MAPKPANHSASPSMVSRDEIAPKANDASPTEYYDENGVGMEAFYVPPPHTYEQDKSDSDEILAMDLPYANFIAQAQGRFQDRPSAPRVREDEVVFVDQAIVEIKALRDEVRSLKKTLKKCDLNLTVISQSLDANSEVFEQLRRTCAEAGKQWSMLTEETSASGQELDKV